MNTKLITLLMLFLLQTGENVHGQKNNKTVFLNGLVKNFNNQIQIEDISEMADLTLPNSDRIFTPNNNNHFSISFDLEKPGYFRLGRNILYLSPGDNISMFVDYNRQDSSTFKGVGSDANNYLKFTPFPKAGSFLEAGDNVKTTIQKTVEEILVMAKRRNISLEKYPNISHDFKLLEQARIKADVLNSLIMLKFYFPYVNHIGNDSLENFKREYTNIVTPYINRYSNKLYLDQSYLQLKVYRDVVSEILFRFADTSQKTKEIKDWINASHLVQKFKSLTEKKNISLYEKEIGDIHTKQYKLAVISTFKKIMEFRNGDTAIDFTMIDINKKLVPLSTFKGKILYIDLWATWCGPCMEELPVLDTLKLKYKNNDEIVFISLSIDNDTQKWLKILEQRNALDHQYIIDRLKLESYSVIAIPRTIIINREFKIEALYGDLPSSKNTISILDKLLIH